MPPEIEKCKECKMCDTIISLHERIKKLEASRTDVLLNTQIETLESEIEK